MLKINKIQVDWSQMPTGITWMIIGAPKTGKSTQASQWSEKGREGVLLLDTDLGSDFIDGAQSIPIVSLNTPETVKTTKEGTPIMTKDGVPLTEEIPPEQRGYVYRNGPNKGKPMPVYSMAEVVFDLIDNWDSYGIDTIVVDTVGVVNEWIEKEVAPNGMGGDFGRSHGIASGKNIDIMLKLQNLVKKHAGTLVMISHSKKTTEVDGKVQLSPELPSGLANRMCAKADIIGYTTIDKKTQQHMISFVGYDERSVGSRIKPLHGKTLPFDYNAVKAEITGYKEK